MSKIKVLIVDDSAVIRTLLTEILSSDAEIEVVGTAGDPYKAREKIRRLDPDVITLDIEMPKMDGLSFLEKLMRLRPMPVVMISSMTQKGADIALRAIELGAFDFIGKPKADVSSAFLEYQDEITEKVKAAANTKSKIRNRREPVAKKKIPVSSLKTVPKHSANVILSKPDGRRIRSGTEKVIAIGASTGGTEAIRQVLENLPLDMPAIVIAQHIPAEFSESFAKRVDSLSQIKVMQAIDDQPVESGCAYIAPGNRHLLLEKRGNGYICRLNDGPAVNRHKPSVDVLFRSVAKTAGDKATGIILTGMGADGALGLKEMSEMGAVTMAQDEATSVVWGMPGEAVKQGAVKQVLSLQNIAPYLIKEVRKSVSKEREH